MTHETLEMLEEEIVDRILKIRAADPEDKKRKVYVGELEMLLDQRKAIDRDLMEFEDKEDRRAVERERNETTRLIEENKQRITWQKVGFELLKLAVPTVISAYYYRKFSEQMYEFEEEGRINATASRGLIQNLPRFWKR